MIIKVHRNESARTATVLFSGPDGRVETDIEFPEIFAFYPMWDGANDDCTYYFRLCDNQVIPCGWNFGLGIYPEYIKPNTPWLDNATGGFHDRAYQKELLAKLKNTIKIEA